MKPPDINKYNLKSALNVFASLSQKYKNIWKNRRCHHIPTYSSQRHRFALKLSIWKTKTKKLPDSPRYLKLFSNARIKLKIPDDGLSRFFNLRARSVASIRFFHKKAF